MHYRSDGLSKDEKAIFKHLEKRLFHEGRVVNPSYTSVSDIPQVFLAINFDCLLNIDKQICPLHVSTIQPSPLTDGHFLTNHVMVPLTEGRAKRFIIEGKMPHPSTSSSSASQSHDDIDSVNNYQPSPIIYHNQLPPILEVSEGFKQTKRMFKCLGHFLPNIGKKKKNKKKKK
ncbi:hypothetical protein Tco_1041394 [Tanacetum coccineum]|uniref:Uncharacterized protein n=1 Tax=Tanacetum coccineum TaxID=301880 RepID=A0ABQ5GH30_9ASTR